MKGTLLLLVLISGYFRNDRFSCTEAKYRVMETQESWKDAWFSCQNLSGSLVPDLGTIDITNQLLPLIQTKGMLWLFAKQITMEYKLKDKSIFRYVEISYRPTETYLDHFLCSSGNTLPSAKYVWKSVREFCERMTGSLMKLGSVKQLRYLMPILKDDLEFWIDKYDGYSLPSLESQYDTEQCVGIIKDSSTTFRYRTVNCTTQLRFICDMSPNFVSNYAPIIKRRSAKFPVYTPDEVLESSNFFGEINNEDGNQQGETTNITLIVGPIAAVLVIFIAVGALVVVYRKKKRRQEKYRKRRERYFNGRSKRTDASLQNRDIQHIDRDGTIDSITVEKNSAKEGMDKGRYVHLHEDATMSTMVSEGEGHYEGQVEKKPINIDQPGYYLMDMRSSRPSYVNKKAAIQVPMCYEPFDPNPEQLKEQIKSIKRVNAKNVKVMLPADLKKSTEYKKTPLKPVKQKQNKSDSVQYKEPRVSQPPELPVKKFKGARYLGNRPRANKEPKPTNVNPLPISDGYGVTQKPEIYASKNLGDTYECIQGNTKQEDNNKPKNADQPLTSLNDLATYEACDKTQASNDSRSPVILDDLDQYENSKYPPSHQITGNPGSPISAKTKGLNQQGLKELDAYENFDKPIADTKGMKNGQKQSQNVACLDELDQYESFETHQIKRKDDVLWKDTDNYENLPLYQ